MTKKVYKVRNWSEYNKGLVSRRSLTVWFNKNLRLFLGPFNIFDNLGYFVDIKKIR